MELADGGIDLSAALPRMHDDEDVYYVTHSSLASLAESLSRASPPLLTRSSGPQGDGRVLKGAVALTDLGRAVLAGRQDWVAVCGLDRWLGGVHWERGADEWRWDDRRQRMTRR